MNINKYFEENREKAYKGLSSRCPPITCADGFKLSVQASEFHYCTPRCGNGPYSGVEVGYPSAREELLMPFAEDAENPTDTVYGWVPIEIVEQVILKHGDIKAAEDKR